MMVKRFKLKISKVIPYFQSCRSKDTSTQTTDPVPSLLRLSPVKSKLITVNSAPTTTSTRPPPKQVPRVKTHRSSFRRHVSSALTSVGCGSKSRSTLSEDDRNVSPDFQWQKEDDWHVVAKVYEEDVEARRQTFCSSISGDSEFDDDSLASPPPPPPPSSAEKKKRRVKKKRTIPGLRISTSSAESGLFSSESFDEIDGEETETLVSCSRSFSTFSTDSSIEFNPRLKTIRENRKKRKGKKVKRSLSWFPESESPARLSAFQRLIPCRVEGKVRESFAVIKKSEDPYEDFKRSMMEMVMEKKMYEEKELEQLLDCFLSLNDPQHHGIIVEAFSEICESLFCTRSSC